MPDENGNPTLLEIIAAQFGGGGGTGGSTQGGPPQYEYDERTRLWYNALDGQPAPQWIQEQLNAQGGQDLVNVPVTVDDTGYFLDPLNPANAGRRTSYGTSRGSRADVPLASREAVEALTGGWLDIFDSARVLDALPDSLRRGLGGGGGGGGGSDPAILARQLQLDKQNSALAIYDAIAGQQSVADQRAQATRTNQLAALPFMVDPGQKYFAGFSDKSPIVSRYGLTEAVPIQHSRFDPAIGPNPYDAALQKALETYRQIAGA